MAMVCEQLRRAREEQKLNVYQVAEITKIKTDHIRALEAGEYQTFSAPVYIRGFVRTYARALKLDPSPLIAALESELNPSARRRDGVAASAGPGRFLDWAMLQLAKLNWRIVLATVAAALVLLLTASALRSSSRNRTDPLKKLGPGLYQDTRSQGGEMLPVPKP